jgi:Ras-related protein Rap-1B
LVSSLDTAGTEQFTAMRELYMKQGQGFLLVFSITNMNSLRELAELHDMIVRIKEDENVPLVIVGNKSDLEEDRQVSRQRVFQLAQQWGNAPYFETSARRRINVDDIFINVCRQIMENDRSRPLGRPLDFETLRQQQQQRDQSDRRYRKTQPRRKRDRCVIL